MRLPYSSAELPNRIYASLLALALLALGLAVTASTAHAGTAGTSQPKASVTRSAATAASIPANGTARTATPLLLVHGWSDDCGTAFRTVSKTSLGSDDTATVNYFTSHGFPIVRLVGYYSGSWTATYDDGSTHSVSDAVSSSECDANVQTGANSTVQSDCGWTFTYTSAPLEALSCYMAWYLYSQPQPVDIIAHSMGGLVVRGAMYYSTHHPSDGYVFPPGALPVSRVITVATPHDGLQGAVAEFYNLKNPDQEIQDMTVCPGYAANCTLSSSIDSLIGGPLKNAKTSQFMSDIHSGGEPKGSVDTYWALMGSSTICNPLSSRTLGSCLARKNYTDDPYTSDDFVVQADSMMGMPADAKIFYGSLEHIDSSGNISDYSSGGPDYAHEANTCSVTFQILWNSVSGAFLCTTAPYYLNDATSGTTTAWMCTSGCNGGITDLPYAGNQSSASTVQYSLGEMARLLLDPTRAQVGHAAHAGNDYPYAGMGLYDHSEGIDGWTEFYGQCDSFGAWKAYENLGGTQRPSAASLPAVGWVPSDAKISPIVSYAGLSSKAGTWGDAHDWIRSDQGLHAAPYFGVPFDGIPQPGSLAVWATSSEDPAHGIGVFGHIAYVSDVIDANTIQIESYNLLGTGEWSTDTVTRSGGGTDNGFGRTISFPWPEAFVHLGDGPAGPVQPLSGSGNTYPAGTYGPTSNSAGPSFSLTGSAYPGTVDGWSVSRGHGVIGWQLWTNTHTGNADSTATWDPALPTPGGCYQVAAFVPDTWSNSSYALYAVTDQQFGTSVVPVDENAFTNQYATLGVFKADSSGHLKVTLTDQGPPNLAHQVAADGLRYIPVACTGLHRTALVMDSGTPGFTTTDVWYSQANHGLRGNEQWTHTNGTAALSTATYTPVLPVGCYLVEAFVPDNYANSPAALYTIHDAAFSTATLADVDQADTTNAFVSLGVFETRSDGTMTVTVTDQNPVGMYVAADAVKFTPASCNAVARDSYVIDPAAGSPDFTLAGPTFGDGDNHGWYTRSGHGLRGNELWTNAGGTTAQSTATYSPSGLPRAGGCVDVRAFVPDNYANNPQAGYSIAVHGPTVGGGVAGSFRQDNVTNAWVDLGAYNIPGNGYITVTINDTGPTTGGPYYTAADAIDFRTVSSC
jgi:surface antigen